MLGLTEGTARALLGPALVLASVGLWTLLRRYRAHTGRPAAAGVLLAQIGLLLMLAGNVVEFGLVGRETGTDGATLLGAGALVSLAGLLGLGVVLIRAHVPPPWSSLPLALGLVCFLGALVLVPFFGLGLVLWGFVLLGSSAATPADSEPGPA